MDAAGTDRVATRIPAKCDEDVVLGIMARLLVATAKRRGLAPDMLVARLSDRAMAELYRLAARSTFEQLTPESNEVERRTDIHGASSTWERWLSSRSSGAGAQLSVVSGPYAS